MLRITGLKDLELGKLVEKLNDREYFLDICGEVDFYKFDKNAPHRLKDVPANPFVVVTMYKDNEYGQPIMEDYFLSIVVEEHENDNHLVLPVEQLLHMGFAKQDIFYIGKTIINHLTCVTGEYFRFKPRK